MEGGNDQCFSSKEPKHWNQLEATEYTQHPNIMMLHFSKKKTSLVFVFCFQKKVGGFCWWFQPSQQKLMKRDFIPKTETGENTEVWIYHCHIEFMSLDELCKALFVPSRPRWFQRNHGSSQVESHIGSLAAKSHVLLNSR